MEELARPAPPKATGRVAALQGSQAHWMRKFDCKCRHDAERAGHQIPLPPSMRDCSSLSSDALDLHRSVWMSAIYEIDNRSGADCLKLRSGWRYADSPGTDVHRKRTGLSPFRHWQGAAAISTSDLLARPRSHCSCLRRYYKKTVQTNGPGEESATAGSNFAFNIWSTFASARDPGSDRKPQHSCFDRVTPLPGAFPGPGIGIPRRFHGHNEGMKTCR